MNDSLEIFEQFSKSRSKKTSIPLTSNCVIYTRVSTKEQADNNNSLDTQLKACIHLSAQRNFVVQGQFGGTYESAKTDERKEFSRMLSFIKKNKERISYIIVYSVDRFSRSGANAIYIASELKAQGVTVLSVTQPTDTQTASGSLQQNIQFIFSQYDNDLRREKCIAGTKERLQKGLWCSIHPVGYESGGKGKGEVLVINNDGDLIKKAFHWKAEYGLSSQEIISKLAALGMKLRPQQLSKIFRNPFYCGLIVNSALDGQIVEGKHEKLVSKEIFLKANEALAENSQHYKHENENIHIPLKRFIKCGNCSTSFTGYLVKKKNLYYYKCNKTGCKCNRSAKWMNNLFIDLLKSYTIDEELVDVLKDSVIDAFYDINKTAIETTGVLEKQLDEVTQKLELLQEKFILGDIDKEIYDKFGKKYKEEKLNIEKEMRKSSFDLSNIQNYVKLAVKLVSKLHKMWELGTYSIKEKLQYILFPEGIVFDCQNNVYRTGRVNELLVLLRYLSDSYGQKERRQSTLKVGLSPFVVGTGIEPVFGP